MVVKLFSLDEFPDRIAVSKLEQYIEGGVFFLDFSRSLKVIRDYLPRRKLSGMARRGAFHWCPDATEQMPDHCASLHEVLWVAQFFLGEFLDAVSGGAAQVFKYPTPTKNSAFITCTEDFLNGHNCSSFCFGNGVSTGDHFRIYDTVCSVDGKTDRL